MHRSSWGPNRTASCGATTGNQSLPGTPSSLRLLLSRTFPKRGSRFSRRAIGLVAAIKGPTRTRDSKQNRPARVKRNRAAKSVLDPCWLDKWTQFSWLSNRILHNAPRRVDHREPHNGACGVAHGVHFSRPKWMQRDSKHLGGRFSRSTRVIAGKWQWPPTCTSVWGRSIAGFSPGLRSPTFRGSRWSLQQRIACGLLRPLRRSR